jgi:hypothetical protein
MGFAKVCPQHNRNLKQTLTLGYALGANVDFDLLLGLLNIFTKKTEAIF